MTNLHASQTLCPWCAGRSGARPLCTRCRSAAHQIPHLPDHAWWSGDLRQALDARDIGAVIRAFRLHPHHVRPVSQQDMARWLTITQGYLSRIENGRAPVVNLNTLTSYVRTLRIPPPLLWFDLPGSRTEAAPGPPKVPASALSQHLTAVITAPTEDRLADTFVSTLSGYSARDQLVGPHDVIELVRHDCAFIRDRLNAVGNSEHRRLQYIAGRYAEFLGWLHQDCGDLDTAEYWTAIALTHAKDIDDPQFLAYTLMRRSNIATDSGNLTSAADFIEAALTHSATLTPRQRAALLRQHAHVSALRAARSSAAADVRVCVDALARAAEAAAEPVQAPDDLAGYCSPEYVTMEAAQCWLELGRPEKALTLLEQRLSEWNNDGRRDLGMGLARLSTAYAGVNSWAEAIEAAGYAATIVAETRSHRTLTQLHTTEKALRAAGRNDAARDLTRQIRRAHPQQRQEH